MDNAYEGSRNEFLKFLVQFDEPAFLRRGRQVEQAWNDLLDQCQRKRSESLLVPRLCLARLAALVDGEWERLTDFLDKKSDAAYLDKLHDQWQHQLRSRITPTKSLRKIRRTLVELIDALAAFNRNWEKYVGDLDLDTINAHRQGYNDYYVFEKACAFRSEYVAQIGFRPLPMVTIDAIFAKLPLLAVPELGS